jgi:DNA-binding MarR family transcriptional regulator
MSKTKSTGLEAFRVASRKYSDASILMHEAISRKAGLTGTDHKYLGLIINKGPLTAGELSRLTGLSTAGVTVLIDRLEKKKLAKREFDKNDRRKVIIMANTENAVKLLTPLFKELQVKTTELLGAYSAREMEIIEHYFLAASNIMDEVREKLNKKRLSI